MDDDEDSIKYSGGGFKWPPKLPLIPKVTHFIISSVSAAFGFQFIVNIGYGVHILFARLSRLHFLKISNS